jgi:hypothetical protein
MKTLHTIIAAFLGWSTAAAVGFLINRGVTQPDGQLFGIGNHTWTTIAWWTIFAIVPLLTTIDAALIPQQDWWAARSTKVGWIAIIALVPAVGPLTYLTFTRQRVANRYQRNLSRRPTHTVEPHDGPSPSTPASNPA